MKKTHITADAYNLLFHRSNVNEVAFKPVNDCDSELRRMLNLAIEDTRNATIEEVAVELERFTFAFGVDTVASFTVFIRGLKD